MFQVEAKGKKKGHFSVPRAIALEKYNHESVLSSAVSKIN